MDSYRTFLGLRSRIPSRKSDRCVYVRSVQKGWWDVEDAWSCILWGWRAKTFLGYWLFFSSV